MLDRWAQRRDVRGHNESQRNIIEANKYHAWDFFNQSNAEANLLIDGGYDEDRASLIASFVKNTIEISSEPIIILSQNQKTKQLLIEMAQADEIGELYVLDSTNNEYDFFSGMKKNNIINFFKNMAASREYTNINSLDSYITAFIEILSVKTNDINLSSLLAFSENTDTQIIDFAIQNDRKTAANALQSAANSRADFRTLLIQLKNAVESLTQRQIESKLSVSKIINNAYVFYIDISDITDDVIAALYFTEEINSVSNKQHTVIFDDCTILTNQVLQESLNKIKQNMNTVVVVSSENIVSTFEEKLRTNFGRQIIFLYGSAASSDTQELLSRFGNYDHQEVFEGVGSPSESFGFFNNHITTNTTTYKRDKIIYDQYKGCTVVSGINESDIMIVKNFVIEM